MVRIVVVVDVADVAGSWGLVMQLWGRSGRMLVDQDRA